MSWRVWLVAFGLVAGVSSCRGGRNQHEPDGATRVAVSFTLTNRPTASDTQPFVAAIRDGTGAWEAAPAPVGDTYDFTVNSGEWGFAWTRFCGEWGSATTSGDFLVNIVELTVTERTAITMDAACFPPSTSSPTSGFIQGAVSNIGSDGGLLYAQFGDAVIPSTPPNWTNVNSSTGAYYVPAVLGTHDLLVLHSPDFGQGTQLVTADRVALIRGLTVPGTTTQDIDFSTAMDTQTFSIQLDGWSGTATHTTLHTANGTIAPLVNMYSDTTSLETAALAGSAMSPGDFYEQEFDGHLLGGEVAIVTNATTTPSAQTLAAPPPLSSVANGPTTEWTAYPNAIGYVVISSQGLPPCPWGGTHPGCGLTWTALLSPGFFAQSPTFGAPDLSTVPGWNSTYFGTFVVSSVTAMTSTDADFPPRTPPVFVYGGLDCEGTRIPAVGLQRTCVTWARQ